MHFGGWQTTGKLFLALPSNLPNVSIQYLLDCGGVHKLKSGRVLILVLTVVASSSLLGFRDWTTASSSAASHSSSSTCQTAGADRLSSRLLSPGPEQQLPTLPAPQGSSTRPETTAEFALPSHCTTGAPAAPGCGEAGRGRALASIRRSSLDVCGVAWYVHGGGEALGRDPERPARVTLWGCDSEPPRLSGSSVWSPPPAVEAGFFFGRIVIAG